MLKVTEIPDMEAEAGIGTWEGEAKLYELSESVNVQPKISAEAAESRDLINTRHIVVSAVEFMQEVGEDGASFRRQQTYIFPTDEKGWPMDMVHLKGSIDGKLDHHKAIMSFITYHTKMESLNG